MEICLAVFYLSEVGVIQNVSGKSRKLLILCHTFFVSSLRRKENCFYVILILASFAFLPRSASLLFMLDNVAELRYEVLERSN